MKKKCSILLSAMLALSSLHAGVLYENSLQKEGDLAGFSWDGKIRLEKDGVTGDFQDRVEYRTIDRKLDARKFSGRLIRLSCEARAENILRPRKVFEGIKLELSMKNDRRTTWGGIRFPSGTFGWKKFETVCAAPADLQSVNLAIGIQNSAGKFQIRNLKVENLGIAVPIRSAANMALKDERAGDNQGGWTDQGPKQDGRCFFGALFQKQFAGIPMDAEPEGKGVLTMYSKYFSGGPKQVRIPIRPAEKAKTLYLMHTMAWGPSLKDKYVGFLTLKDKNGKKQEISIVHNRDVADWYRHVTNLKNGYGVLKGRTGDGNLAGLYLSRFPVDPSLGEIAEVEFRAVPECIWLILGATLSPTDLPLPSTVTTKIRSGSEWLPIQRSEQNRIRAGSALDLSAWMRKGTVDELGRVVIRNGHFVFEKNPTERIRFLTNAVTPHVDLRNLSHKELADLAREMRRNGYNMVRTHFLDQSLMLNGPGKDLEFNPSMLDKIDYFLYCMKQNGIYWNFDCMTSWVGYTTTNMHKMKDHTKSFKSLIFHDPAVRANWRKGVERFLCRVNPYTKTRLIDDPVLVMAVAFNEQEFGLWRDFDEHYFLPRWRKFLKQKYSTIENLHKAWGPQSLPYKDFDEIPCLKGYSRNLSDLDAAEFLLPIEQEMTGWYEKQMRELGFKGYLVHYNCGKNQFFNYLRKDLPFVAMNHYHDHPSNWVSKYSFIRQQSAIESAAQIIRNFMATRQFGKPFVITEQNIAFWNRYRYEQGFLLGGYAAFQDLDALTCHGSPVSFRKVNDIQTFGIWMDPIAKASEYLTYFLFIRGDVSSTGPAVRIRARKQDIFRPETINGGLSTEQTLPALLAGYSTEFTEGENDRTRLLPGEIAYRIGSTNSVLVNQAGYSTATDNPTANMTELLLHLRKAKILPPSNRSDGKTIFESCTGELLLIPSRKFMRIRTPRLQGICATAGTVCKLPQFEIRKMTADGNLALVSIDGKKNIADAERLMLVYATNALNSDMEFSTPEMITLVQRGHGPTLLKRGSFTVTVKNRHAANLKLYPLDLAGNRLKTILPERRSDSEAIFSVDTGKDGAAIYFELAIR